MDTLSGTSCVVSSSVWGRHCGRWKLDTGEAERRGYQAHEGIKRRWLGKQGRSECHRRFDWFPLRLLSNPWVQLTNPCPKKTLTNVHSIWVQCTRVVIVIPSYLLLMYCRGMSGANCFIGLRATDWTEEVRQPEGSYQPELSVQCCRLPLRGNNQSDGWLQSTQWIWSRPVKKRWTAHTLIFTNFTFLIIIILLHNTPKKFCKIKLKKYSIRSCVLMHWSMHRWGKIWECSIICRGQFGTWMWHATCFENRALLSYCAPGSGNF